MPFVPPESDVPVAQLTLAGRNLLARSIVPRAKITGMEPDRSLVAFKLAGFALGDGGYKLDNPLQLSPIDDATTQALATIAILDNRFDVNDSLVINGVPFPVGIVVVASGNATGGADNTGPTTGYNDGTIDNSAGGGGTLTVAPNTLAANAHVGQRLRLVGGTLAGLDEQIVTNTTDTIEIGILDPPGPIPPIGVTVGKSWEQAGSSGLLPDVSTQWQIITNSPGAGTWVPGADEEETAQNIADAINSSTHPLIENVVVATVVNAVVTVSAVSAGSLGNFNTLVEFDTGGLSINNFGITPGTGFLAGGLDPSMENPRFPATAPNDVEAFLDIEFPNSQATSLVCRASQTEANFGLGEVGIYVDIIDSVNPQEIGERILYAIGHFPIVAKNAKSVFVTRVITQY
jgi:hypothetical protein